MIKEAFGKGATTEAAIEAAKSELGAPWDADVQIEVLKTAKKKTLGLFGGSLAEVRAYYEVPDPSRSLLLRIRNRQSRRKKQRLKSPKPRKKLLPKSRKLSRRRKKPSVMLQRQPKLI